MREHVVSMPMMRRPGEIVAINGRPVAAERPVGASPAAPRRGEYSEIVRNAYRSRIVPMPADLERIFRRAVELARQEGVAFAPGAVHVWCYAGRPDEVSVCLFRERPVEIYLNLGDPAGTEEGWAWLILHELGHAFYDPAYLDSPSEEREARADAFADRAMERWR